MQDSASIAVTSVSPEMESNSNLKDTIHSSHHFAAVPLPPNLDSSNSLYHHHAADIIHHAIARAREPFQATSASLHSDFSTYPHFHHHHYEVYPNGSYYNIGMDAINPASQISEAQNLDFGSSNQGKHEYIQPKLNSRVTELSMPIPIRSYPSSSVSSRKPRENLESNSLKNSKPDYPQDETDGNTDQIKRQKFLERNRVAASKCREKKKKKIQELEAKSSLIFKQNRELQKTIEMLRRETDGLKTKLLHFQTSCKCFSIPQ